jgi:hypothetical protein
VASWSVDVIGWARMRHAQGMERMTPRDTGADERSKAARKVQGFAGKIQLQRGGATLF